MSYPSDNPPSCDAPLTLVTLGRHLLLPYPEATESLLPPGKPLSLLTYMAMTPGRRASREHLLDLLWADREPEDARHALRQMLRRLRQAFGESALQSARDELVLGLSLRIDRDDFVAALETGDSARAVALYRHPFLPEPARPGGASFEHWADLERGRLTGLFLRVGELEVRERLRAGLPREAEELARRMCDAAPEEQSAWRLLLTASLTRNRLLAGADADRLEVALHDSGRPPEPATLAIIREVRANSAAVAAVSGSTPLEAELVGRTGQFTAILRGWDEVQAGRPRHIHLSGPAGSGKSRLLADVQRRLKADGARVVTTRPVYADREVEFAGAVMLAEAVVELPGAAAIAPASAAVLVGLAPALSARFATPPLVLAGPEAIRLRASALRELLDAVADEAPFALCIDDLHWMDQSSRAILQSLLARTVHSRILVLTAARPTDHSPFSNDSTVHLALPPLSPEESFEAVATLGTFDQADDLQWVEALHRSADGSPLFLLEGLRLAIDREFLDLAQGRWKVRDQPGLLSLLGAGSALGRRIASLDSDARWLLDLVAVSGAPLAAGDLAVAADRDPRDLDRLLGSLERQGMLASRTVGWDTTHDQISEAARQSATPERIYQAHRAVGTALASRTTEDALLLSRAARQLATAGEWTAVGTVYTRFVRLARQRGDHRSPGYLVDELLGAGYSTSIRNRLVRRLPIGARLGTRGLIRAAAAACGLLAVGGLAGALLTRPPGAPGATLTVTTPMAGGEYRWFESSVRREGWEAGRALAVHQSSPGNGAQRWPGGAHGVRMSPDGRFAAYYANSRDSGAIDLYLYSKGGGEVRLTDTPGDDVGPSWSPDGRSLAFTTARWSTASEYRIDLALMDLPSRLVTVLARGQAEVAEAAWSFDGTRVGFVRRKNEGEVGTVCVVTVDGRGERCVARDSINFSSVTGWADTYSILVTGTVRDTIILLQVDPTGGSIRRIAAALHSRPTISPDGQWAVARFLDPPTWRIFPATQPWLARPLDIHDESDGLAWVADGTPATYLDTVSILGPPLPLAIGIPEQLLADFRDQQGARLDIPPGVLEWQSEDTAIAVIDPWGRITGRRTGQVSIRASAGGWREAARRFEIAVAPPVPMLRERWDSALSTRWITWGEPEVRRIAVSGGGWELFIAGDAAFSSGVLSKASFPAVRGLGVDVAVRVPLTGRRNQFMEIGWTDGMDSTGLEGWTDHRVELPDAAFRSNGWCGIQLPARPTTRQHLGRAAVSAGGSEASIPLPGASRDETRWLVRLQLFADGSCGTSLNGTHVWRSTPQLRTDGSFRLFLRGQSVGTQITVGSMNVWQGEK